MRDGAYRASLRGDSSHVRSQALAAAELLKAGSSTEGGKERLIETRQRVRDGWRGVSDKLMGQGNSLLANEVKRFADAMAGARTDREQIAVALGDTLRSRRMGWTTAEESRGTANLKRSR